MKQQTIRYSIIFGAFGILQYLIISSITMVLYHGGDRFDPTAEGYNFFGSFLSDLGRMHAFTGMPTYDTGIFYAIALGFMGVGTLVFFGVHRYLIPNSNEKIRSVATWMGYIAGLGYIAVAITPWDLYPAIHLISVFTCFIAFMICCVAMYLLIKQQSGYPNVYGKIFLFFGGLIGLYILFMATGPSSEFETGRIVQATGQKILVYSQSILMIICCYGAFKQTHIYV